MMGRGNQETYFTSGYAQFCYWIQQRLYETVVVTVLSNKIRLLYVCLKINGRFDNVTSFEYGLYCRNRTEPRNPSV